MFNINSVSHGMKNYKYHTRQNLTETLDNPISSGC
jgi:hypothetical protein